MKVLSTNELRGLFVRFFESKGHAHIPSAPLIPENDPSVLFTTAGMHPLVPYLKGAPHPAGTRLVDWQKCLRTTDIDDVGDATHATVFEMLGNWSLGDYFKKEAIVYSWEFLTSPDWLGLDPNYLAVSVFAGDADAPRDEESAATWQLVGVAPERIAFLDKGQNWWPAYAAIRPRAHGRGEASAGKPAVAPVGLQGPDTEMFYWTGSTPPPTHFDPSDKQWVEIWNDVFMQFNRREAGELTELPQKNVDTGMGLERVLMVLNNQTSIYDIDSFEPLLKLIANKIRKRDERHERILADHIKATTFVLGDENAVKPSNADQGYVLRRIIRRAVMSSKTLGVEDVVDLLVSGSEIIINQYGSQYTSLNNQRGIIQIELRKEIEKFSKTLKRGLPIARKTIQENKASGLTGAQAFDLVTTYGIPLEVIKDVAAQENTTLEPNFKNDFDRFYVTHQESSAKAARGKFKGGLVDHSEMSIKYHTATHLLHQALRDVLGPQAVQRGSNITPERLRFDFAHTEKLTPEQLERVTAVVNEKIAADLPVTHQEMRVEEARAQGALGLFSDRYGEHVSVYRIGDYSMEICGGPHVERTGVLGRLAITKEESAGSGVRRIRAVLE